MARPRPSPAAYILPSVALKICHVLHAHDALTENPPGRDFGDLDAQFLQKACAGWPAARVPAAFYRLPAANSPILLLSGSDDPVTPPRHAAKAMRSLGSLARQVVVPHAGHGVAWHRL